MDGEQLLRETGHVFKIGLIGFGPLGQAIFRRLLPYEHIQVSAIDGGDLDAEQIASILRQSGCLPRIVDVQVSKTEDKVHQSLIISDGKTRRMIHVSTHADFTPLFWETSKTYYVIHCTAHSTSLSQVTPQLRQGGARRVLIADASDAPPYEVQCQIFTWDSAKKQSPWTPLRFLKRRQDPEETAEEAVNLLVNVLCRDAAGATFLWHEAFHQTSHTASDIVEPPSRGLSCSCPWQQEFGQCLNWFLGRAVLDGQEAGQMARDAIQFASKKKLWLLGPQLSGWYVCVEEYDRHWIKINNGREKMTL